MSTPAVTAKPVSRVLFVDDEPHLLSGLRRRLHVMAPHWRVAYAESGAEALQLMQNESFDVVVSDLRMPGMDGAALLHRVQDAYPSTVRMVLSGEAERATLLAASSSAHQFLAKPCEPEDLISIIDRAVEVRAGVTDESLRELIGGVGSLPSLPAVYSDLMRTLATPDCTVEEVAQILATDVAASVEVLRLTNSSFFGLQRRIENVRQAVSLLGLDTIQAVVTAGLLFQSQVEASTLDIPQLRHQALQRTATVRRIAQREGWNTVTNGPLALAAMLRDIGALVLGEGRPDQMAELTERWRAEPELLDDPLAVREIERSVLGCTVSQTSAYMLALWGFSPRVQHLVAAQPVVPIMPGVEPGEVAITLAHQRAVRPDAPHQDVLDMLDRDRTERSPGREQIQRWIELSDEAATRLAEEATDDAGAHE